MITTLIVVYLLIECAQEVHGILVNKYNETEAKILVNLAAGAYSTDPEKCVINTLPKWQKWLVYSTESTMCDIFQNSCSSYIIRSDIIKEIIIVFRGTTTKKQLITQGWQSMKSMRDFFGVGMVNRYFFEALEHVWPNIELVLKDPIFKSYPVTFTGHSLGGAIASLAATRTVIKKLRTGDKIKLITFGQPRTGDYQYAMYHNDHIPFSFRLVHRLDLVPHILPCKKNASQPGARNRKSKPCLTGMSGSPYHHGIEIWYPYGMAKDAEYYVCLGKPTSEDFNCSNSLTYDFKDYNIYIDDHRHYFNIKLGSFGKRGCIQQVNSSSSETPLFASYIDTISQKFQEFKQRISDFLDVSKKRQ
ncbi:Lipase (class 3) family protein [Acanthocheilonema viteae]